MNTPTSWEFAVQCLDRVLSTPLYPVSPPLCADYKPSEQMQWYCASLLDHVSTPRLFDVLPPQHQIRIMKSTHDVLTRVHLNLFPSSLGKLFAAYVKIGRGCLTDVDASFLTSTLSLMSSRDVQFASIGSRAFVAICEEFPSSDPGAPVSGAKYLTVQRLLNGYLPSFGSCLNVCLNQHAGSEHIVSTCLRGLSAVLSFPTRSTMMQKSDVTACMTVELISSLFSLASPASSHSPSIRAQSLECVNDIVGRACWPSERSVDFLLAVTGNAVSIVGAYAEGMAQGRGNGDDEEPVRSQLVYFLEIFCENHLRRAVGHPSFNIADFLPSFLSLMAQFTFKLPSLEERGKALSAWSQVADCASGLKMADDSDRSDDGLDAPGPGHAFLAASEVGLLHVLTTFLDHNFFCRESSFGSLLSDLDGGEVLFPSVDAGVVNSQEEEDRLRVADEDDADAALREIERGTLLADTCVLNRKLTALSSACAVGSFDHVCALLSESFAALQLSLTSGKGADEVEKRCWDCAVCLRVLNTGGSSSAVKHSSHTHMGKLLEIANYVFSFCGFLINEGAWQGQPSLVELVPFLCSAVGSFHATILQFSVFAPDIVPHGSTFSIGVLSLCGAAISSSSSSRPLPPPAMTAFCDLLLSASVALTPKLKSDPSAELLAACQGVVGGSCGCEQFLSRRQVVTVHRAATNLVFSLRDERQINASNERAFRSQADAFVNHLLPSCCTQLAEAGSQAVSGRGNFALLTGIAPLIERKATALEAICRQCGRNMGKHGKEVLKQALDRYVGVVLETLSVFMNFSIMAASGTGDIGANSSVSSAASALSNLVVTIVDCLGSDLAINFKVTCLNNLFASFSSLPAAVAASAIAPSHVTVIRSLLRILTVIFSERSAPDGPIANLIPSACHLVKTRLAGICESPENAPDLLPPLIELCTKILAEHWKSFVRNNAVLNETSRANLETLVEPFLFCLQQSAVLPPDVVGMAVGKSSELGIRGSGLRGLGTAKISEANLFALPDFLQRMRTPVMSAAMQALLGMHQMSLVEELSELVLSIARVDNFAWYYAEFVPSLSASFSPEQRAGLVIDGSAVVNARGVDELAFKMQLDAYLTQVKYVMG